MNEEFFLSMAVRLCGADVGSAFISLEPVLGGRDELIRQRVDYYHDLLKEIYQQLAEGPGVTSELIEKTLPQAVELTAADILSGFIAVSPILYDRNTRISERLSEYFGYLSAIVQEKVVLETALSDEMYGQDSVQSVDEITQPEATLPTALSATEETSTVMNDAPSKVVIIKHVKQKKKKKRKR